MDFAQFALFALAAIIFAGISFLLWALLRLELDKKHHGGWTAHPADHRRMHP